MAQSRTQEQELVEDRDAVNEPTTLLDGADIASWKRIDKTRRRLWIQIIKRANAAQHISAYSNDVMKMSIIAFEDICDEIPTEHLWRSYIFSMRQKRDRLWSASDCWHGWELYQKSEEYRKLSAEVSAVEAARLEELRRNCERCYSSGMDVVPGKGARRCTHEPLTEAERLERKKALSGHGGLYSDASKEDQGVDVSTGTQG
jgi:hypothetical protein